MTYGSFKHMLHSVHKLWFRKVYKQKNVSIIASDKTSRSGCTTRTHTHTSESYYFEFNTSLSNMR